MAVTMSTLRQARQLFSALKSVSLSVGSLKWKPLLLEEFSSARFNGYSPALFAESERDLELSQC